MNSEHGQSTGEEQQRPTPERIFRTITAYQETAALRAGIDLDLFTAIGEGTNDAPALAKRTGAAERGVRILCDYLTVLGFLNKPDGHYELTPESAVFLDRRSTASMCNVPKFLMRTELVQAFEQLTAAVKKGGTALADGNHEKPHEEMWVEFARSMAPMTVPSANLLAEVTGMKDGKNCRVLDIAAGHGLFGIALARVNPRAEITAVDWPAVLEVAKENAAAAGAGERYKTIAGSAFETDFGEGYDFVLLTNIFHHFDQATCEVLMRRVHAALKPGGKAVTLEFVPEENRVCPPMSAMFSLLMLASTDHGEAYTLKQYETMFGNVGFRSTEMVPNPGLPQQVLVSEK